MLFEQVSQEEEISQEIQAWMKKDAKSHPFLEKPSSLSPRLRCPQDLPQILLTNSSRRSLCRNSARIKAIQKATRAIILTRTDYLSKHKRAQAWPQALCKIKGILQQHRAIIILRKKSRLILLLLKWTLLLISRRIWENTRQTNLLRILLALMTLVRQKIPCLPLFLRLFPQWSKILILSLWIAKPRSWIAMLRKWRCSRSSFKRREMKLGRGLSIPFHHHLVLTLWISSEKKGEYSFQQSMSLSKVHQLLLWREEISKCTRSQRFYLRLSLSSWLAIATKSRCRISSETASRLRSILTARSTSQSKSEEAESSFSRM